MRIPETWDEYGGINMSFEEARSFYDEHDKKCSKLSSHGNRK